MFHPRVWYLRRELKDSMHSQPPFFLSTSLRLLQNANTANYQVPNDKKSEMPLLRFPHRICIANQNHVCWYEEEFKLIDESKS